MLIDVLLLGSAIALLALGGWLFHKLRKVHIMMHDVLAATKDNQKQVRNEGINLFQQIQLLPELYSELGLTHGLPPLRGWAASPDFLLVLARHVKERRPQSIIECGGGASTFVLARCLQLQGSGRLYSLENDAEIAAEIRRKLASLGLDEWVTVIDAPLTNCQIGDGTWSWYAKDKLPDAKFDMIVVDGPPVFAGPLARYPAGPLLLPRLTAGGTCLMDDMIREDEQQIVDRWMRENPRLTRTDYHCEKGCTALVATMAS